MNTSLQNHRSRSFSRLSALACLMLFALTASANAQISEIASRSRSTTLNFKESVTAKGAPPSQRSSIVVTIDPRFPTGGTGSAIVQLRNGRGEVLITAVGLVGLGRGINGPRRDVRYGDTPFGVYKYVRSLGGRVDSKLSPAFGTGKLNLDDEDTFGEVKDAGRSLIRLHGGGSRLPDPYALDHDLVPTAGCVRLRNRDINALIQLIKGLPQEESLEFIFMGNDAYLRNLATDANLSDKRWWNVLRRDLQLPPGPHADFMHASWTGPSPRQPALQRNVRAFQVDTQLIESIKLFAEDAGPRGRSAFDQLRLKTASLSQLQNSLPQDDALRPMIAFALCYAGRDCAANIAVIESALKKPAPFKGFYADEAQEMLSRLIDKASQENRPDEVKSLIVKLLTAAPEADGALSEGLGVTLSVKLRDQTSSFVAALNELTTTTTNAAAIRKSALDLIVSAEHLTTNDLANITRRIERNPGASLTTKQKFMEFSESYKQAHQQNRPRKL